MPSIKKPGLEVIQEIRTRTPTFFRSTFPPAVIGPCYQIIDATTSTGALNTSAVLSLPAMVTGTATGATFAVGAMRVRCKVNGANDIEYLLPGTAGQALPIATVVSKLNEGFAGYLVFSSVSNYLRVRTVATGDSASLQFLAPSASSAHTILGFVSIQGLLYTGTGDYDNHPFLFPYLSLPDTRGIINYLTFAGDDITIYRVQAGSPIALNEDSCINWSRQNRVDQYYSATNGGAAPTALITEQDPTWYFERGHVYDSQASPILTSSVASTKSTLTGHQLSTGARPLNAYLYPDPTGTGSTTDRVRAIGRHAYADIQLGYTGAEDYYHFEAHGLQLWAADSSVTPGLARGSSGNLLHMKFAKPTAYADDGATTVAVAGTATLTSAGYGTFAGDIGKYIYIYDLSLDTYYGEFLITGVGAGPGFAAEFADPLGVIPSEAGVSWCISETAGTKLPSFATTNSGSTVLCTCTYATTATQGLNTLTQFDTQFSIAGQTHCNYFGPDVSVSYLNASATGTSRMQHGLDTKDYYLMFGADPPNFGTVSNTHTYAQCIGEAPMNATALAALAGKELTVRINGGPVSSYTLLAGDVNNTTTLMTALNTAFDGGGTPIFTVEAPVGLGPEYCYDTGSVANAGADTAITGATVDFATIGVSALMKVWISGASVSGGTRGVMYNISSVSGGVITLANVNLGTIASVNIKVLAPDNTAHKVVKAILHADNSTEAYAGVDSSIEFGGTARDLLFKSPYSSSTTDYSIIFRGDPLPLAAGDQLYENGTLIGTVDSLINHTWDMGLALGTKTHTNSIIKLSSAGATVNTPLLTWYITSNGILSTETGTYTGTGDKPLPEVVFSDTLGTIWLKAGLARNSDGIEVAGNVTMTLLAAYSALRRDITALGANPLVQIINSYDELSTQLGPISPSNPLALGVYFAQLNATFGESSIQVKCLGVDEVSTNMPYGTVGAYTRALVLFQSARAYGMSVMTHSDAIHDLLQAHITTMSSASGRSERVGYICQTQPTERAPTLCGSDTTAAIQNLDAVGGTFEVVIDPTTGFTITAALTGKTTADGSSVTTFGSVSIPEGVFIRRSGDSFRYSVSEIKAGNILKCRSTGFAPGYGPSTSGNDDLYWSTAVPGDDDDHATWDVDGEVVSLYIRQAAIDMTTSTGKSQAITAMTTAAQSFADRRMRFVQPDTAVYQYSGVSTTIPGFYMTAALAGRTAARPPQESFTKGTIAGIDAVQGSWDAFSEEMMDEGAGGGIWWMTQVNEDGAVYTRHQLTTDVSSYTTKEASVTHALDYISERVRLMLAGIGGKYNLTPNFLAYLSMVVNTICSSMTGTVVQSCLPGDIAIDETEPDAVNIVLNVRPWSIGNYIRVRIVV